MRITTIDKVIKENEILKAEVAKLTAELAKANKPAPKKRTAKTKDA